MLCELERLGTIAAVAGELHLTPPAVSMQLAALEREVGLELTERQGRRVVLTPAGAVLARHGRAISDLVGVAELEVHALRQGESGTYRVAAFPTAARSYLATAWRALRDGGPALRLVELEPGDATAALIGGDADLAVVHSYSNVPRLPRDGLVATPLAVEEVLLATSAQEDVELAGLAGADWILPHGDLTCAEMVKRACAAAGFQPRVVAEATDHAVQLELVAAGLGVALIPRLAAREVPPNVHLHPMSVERHHFALTRRSASADAGIRRIVEALREHARPLVGRS
jgi:DNA-binding transcriptional LysR family regulator